MFILLFAHTVDNTNQVSLITEIYILKSEILFDKFESINNAEIVYYCEIHRTFFSFFGSGPMASFKVNMSTVTFKS